MKERWCGGGAGSERDQQHVTTATSDCYEVSFVLFLRLLRRSFLKQKRSHDVGMA